MEFELFKWGDGTIRLSYEDYMHGHDRHFILLEDGTVQESVTQEDDSEVLVTVNLAIELRKMVSETTS